MASSRAPLLLLLMMIIASSFFCAILPAVRADPAIQLCINDMTANASEYLRFTRSINPELDTYNYTLDYTAPMADPPQFSVPPEYATAASQIPLLEGSSLHKVRIDPNSPQGRGMATNLRYLLMLDVDNLAYSFRNTSGLAGVGVPYGGWEAPNQELRGHFVGHYLSATAKMWASTHNADVKKRMDALVDILAECQQKIGTGYLSAFPVNLFTRWETYRPVWAPYYTAHKIMSGLLDQYTDAGNEKALRILLWMVQYFSRRVENYIEKFGINAHYLAQNEETGGMNEVLYDLYKITGDPAHLRLAHLFDKPCFLGPLALKSDTLSGLHVNTHLPILLGAQGRYEVTGEQTFRDLAVFFMDSVNASHRFITGGTSDGEFWKDPNTMGTSLGKDVEETCSSYNMLKISRNLFRWTRDVRYADYYERLLINGIMTVQRAEDPGVMIYMLPMGAGMAKTSSTNGWGNPFDSFWCCYGSGIESFSKLGDSIYFEDHGVRDKDPGAQVPIPQLYVIQYVPSTLEWDATGLILKQSVKPMTSYDPIMEVTIELLENPKAHVDKPSPFVQEKVILNVRIPSWLADTGYEAYFNDEPQVITPGSFLTIQGTWNAGDTLRFKFPAKIILEHVEDYRHEFKNMNGIMFGPLVMGGLSQGDYKLGPVNASNPSEWLQPINPTVNDQLYTFHSGKNQLGHRNGTIVVDHAKVSGTDWDFQASFKLNTVQESSSGAKSNSSFGLLGKTVTIELMDQPGQVISHNGINNNLVTTAADDNRFAPANMQFKIVPALMGDEGHVSLESADFPGCYVHVEDWRIPLQLQCKGAQNATFDSKISFEVSKPLTTYHPMSFVAHGAAGNRNYVFFPQTSYVDQHYTIYFDMS